MDGETGNLSGPDLTFGVELSTISDRTMLLGHAHREPVLLVRRGAEFFAICTHDAAPLGDGLLVGDTVRLPWHHACFSLRTGKAVRAPALDPLSCRRVEVVHDLKLAVAMIHRDLEGLRAEIEFERAIAAKGASMMAGGAPRPAAPPVRTY